MVEARPTHGPQYPARRKRKCVRIREKCVGMTYDNNNNKRRTRTSTGDRNEYKQCQPQQVGEQITSIYAKTNDVNEDFQKCGNNTETEEE